MRLRIGMGMARMRTLCCKIPSFAGYVIYGNALSAAVLAFERAFDFTHSGQNSDQTTVRVGSREKHAYVPQSFPALRDDGLPAAT